MVITQVFINMYLYENCIFGVFAVIQHKNLSTVLTMDICYYLWIHLTGFGLHIAILLKSEGIFGFVKKKI